jgi:thiopeptide-type bacteriocin biosynthesis protein
MDDLLVSVRDGRVILRSKRLGREVVPRLSTAHNYTTRRSLGVYRFLCALQAQGTGGGLSWDWGVVARAPFLPRVVHESVIFERATWNVDNVRLKPLAEATGSAVWRQACRLREELGLPRFITVDDGDNRLPIDLDEILSIEAMANLVRTEKTVRISEVSTTPERQLATGPAGRFAHELVVPFIRKPSAARPARTTAPHVASKRRVTPGNEWLYVKLYGGAVALDDALCRVAAPVVRAALAEGHADGWFFIRYSDPDTHLRVRVHGPPDALARHVEPALLRAGQTLVDEGLLWRMQLDTYHRELERYGGDEGLRLCERWFAADSDAALEITERTEGVEGADARWRLALYGLDRSLDVLGLSLAEKLAMMTHIAAGYAREFSVDTALDRQLGERFRKERGALEALLFEAASDDHPLKLGIETIERRDARLRPIAVELRDAVSRGALGMTLPTLAQSLVHMHCNRLLRAAARANELVLYDFSARLYRGRVSRQKGKR